jgi:hypothetical protein
MPTIDVEEWLREQCGQYRYDLRGVFRVGGATPWPLAAPDAADLEAQLAAHGHLLPLPKEPAALANVLEVSIVNFLLERIDSTQGQLEAARGGERFYPDLEISGPAVNGGYHAVDIKVAGEARRNGDRAIARRAGSRSIPATPTSGIPGFIGAGRSDPSPTMPRISTSSGSTR